MVKVSFGGLTIHGAVFAKRWFSVTLSNTLCIHCILPVGFSKVYIARDDVSVSF